MRHVYLISIKNRFKHLETLINQVINLYEDTDYTPVFSITDFNSSDCDLESYLKSISIEYIYKNIDANFNLGLGWNTSALHSSISEDDILVFTCNDIRFTEDISLAYMIDDYTKKSRSIFIPVHYCEAEDKSLQFAGGSAFWSCYKKDFLNIGKIPESETWSDAFTLPGGRLAGEEDFFMYQARNVGLKLNRWNERKIIASWHERDFSEKWYKDSKCVIQRDMIKYTPKWWTIK